MQQIRHWNIKNHEKDGFSLFYNSTLFCPGTLFSIFYLAVFGEKHRFYKNSFLSPDSAVHKHRDGI
jgi:hypothetical protein